MGGRVIQAPLSIIISLVILHTKYIKRRLNGSSTAHGYRTIPVKRLARAKPPIGFMNKQASRRKPSTETPPTRTEPAAKVVRSGAELLVAPKICSGTMRPRKTKIWATKPATAISASRTRILAIGTWGDTCNAVSSCSRSHSRAKGPGTSAGAFSMAHSLYGEDPRGPRRGALCQRVLFWGPQDPLD